MKTRAGVCSSYSAWCYLLAVCIHLCSVGDIKLKFSFPGVAVYA